MRAPFGWTLPRQISLPVLCVCLAIWSAPVDSRSAPGQIAPAPVVSTPAHAVATSTASDNKVQIAVVSVDRRVLALVAMMLLFGTIAGRSRRGSRAPRVRLLIKPRKIPPTVLVPPGPAPRLVPGESPNATRARWAPAPVLRKAPTGTGSGLINYIAPFLDSGEASEKVRVDYLLEPDDRMESPDPPAGRA